MRNIFDDLKEQADHLELVVELAGPTEIIDPTAEEIKMFTEFEDKLNAALDLGAITPLQFNELAYKVSIYNKK